VFLPPDEDLRESLALGDARRDEAAYPQSDMLEFNSSSEVIEQPSTAVTGERFSIAYYG